MVPAVHNAADNDFQIELIHIRRVGPWITRRVSPYQHNSKLFCRIRYYSGSFNGRAAALGKGSRRRFVVKDAAGRFKHASNVQEAPSLVRARQVVAAKSSAHIAR